VSRHSVSVSTDFAGMESAGLPPPSRAGMAHATTVESDPAPISIETKDLKQTTVHRVNDMTLSSTTSSDSTRTSPAVVSKPWRPSVVQLGPLTGIAALLFAFLQIFATFAILWSSRGDLVKNWQYQPSVYLAVL
jgi:hypothetical protein